MSTRCNVLVKYNGDDYFTQYYHHWDGYPEYMGELLKSFVMICKFIGGYRGSNEKASEIFKHLLLAEEGFEHERCCNLHGDIEYLWYVNLNEYKVTYTKIGYGDEDENYLKNLKKEKQGEIEYFVFI